MFRGKFYIILIVIFLLLGHYLGFLRPLENFAGRVFGGAMSAGYSWGRDFFSFFDRFQNNAALLEENKNLKEKISGLESEIVSLKDVLRQKDIVDEQLSFLKQKRLNAVLARVVTRGTENNANQIIINKGSRDGIKNGFVVLSKDGAVVGRVVKTEDTFAQVLFLIDSNVEIGAADSNGVLLGVVKGNSDLSLRLNYVLKEKKLAKGDIVVTSGEKDLVPAGLLIGEVETVFEDEREIFKSARLTQAADFQSAEIVSVILP